MPQRRESVNLRRLPAGRKADLIAFVAEHGEVSVSHLAEHFQVSPDTIRRDLEQLDKDGALVRTYGGALSHEATLRPDTAMDVRERIHSDAKVRIGGRAAQLVAGRNTLLVNGGTTTLEFVRHLPENNTVTIATNSLRIASEMPTTRYRDLFLFGGKVDQNAQATVGAVTLRSNSSGPDMVIQSDLAVIGVGGISEETGYMTSNAIEASMISAMMERAATVAVIADSSKFSRMLFAQIAELSAADILITDAAPPEPLLAALKKADVELVIAD